MRRFYQRIQLGLAGLSIARACLGAIEPESVRIPDHYGLGGFLVVEWRGLGDLPGGAFDSVATAVNYDGSVIVGSSQSARSVDNPPAPGSVREQPFLGTEAFWWSAETGMIGLGDLPGDEWFHSFASAVSDDGRIVVGGSWSEDSMRGLIPGAEGFRFDAQTGEMNPLGVLTNGMQQHSPALGVSPDGSYIVGQVAYHDGWYQGYVWTDRTGIVGVGNLGSIIHFGQLRDATDDGVFVGSDHMTIAGGACQVPVSADRSRGLVARDGDCGTILAIAADGSVAVGAAGATRQAARWTRDGVEFLPGPDGVTFERSQANAVSHDGRVAAGWGSIGGRSVAVVWNEFGDAVLVDDLLAAASGTNGAAGWSFGQALGVSGDGRVLVGYGVNPAGNREAWMLRLDTIDPISTRLMVR
ncbi:MAG: hypothetical protein ACF8PN_03965 [Phycisphaerales bacterium]